MRSAGWGWETHSGGESDAPEDQTLSGNQNWRSPRLFVYVYAFTVVPLTCWKRADASHGKNESLVLF